MQENQWHKLCITDKTGKEFFKTTASPMSTPSELKNLGKHLQLAKANKFPGAYTFLDIDSAYILLDGVPYNAGREPSPSEMKAMLDELENGLLD